MTTTAPPTRRGGPGAHPAIAKRRTRVRRVKRARVVGVAAGVAAGVGLGVFLAVGPVLTVTGVGVTDYPGPNSAPLRAAVAEAASRGGSLLSAPVGDIRRAALTDPWVADVVVHRDWPTGLSVEVIPSHPVAVGVTRGGGTMLLSADGRSMGPAKVATSQLARVRVPVAAPLPLGAPVPASARAPIAFVAALDPQLAARITDIRQTHGLVIARLRGGPELRAGTPGDMAAKAAAVMAVLDQVSDAEQASARYLDVSVPDHPALGGPNADPKLTRGVVEAPAPAPAPAAPTAPATPGAAPAAPPSGSTATPQGTAATPSVSPVTEYSGQAATPVATGNAGQTSTSTTS